MVAAVAREYEGVLPRDYDARASSAQVTAGLRAALAANDPRGWTSGCGTPHPSGGYHDLLVIAQQFSVMIRYRDEHSQTHREDGPAEVSFDVDACLVEATWARHGQLHREDGPSTLHADPSRHLRFHLRDVELGEGFFTPGTTAAGRARAGADFAAMISEGDTPAQAISWLAVGAALGDPGLAQGLREAGAGADACRSATDTGITDADVVAEVGHGRLPLSWALAGL